MNPFQKPACPAEGQPFLAPHILNSESRIEPHRLAMHCSFYDCRVVSMHPICDLKDHFIMVCSVHLVRKTSICSPIRDEHKQRTRVSCAVCRMLSPPNPSGSSTFRLQYTKLILLGLPCATLSFLYVFLYVFFSVFLT